MRTLTTLSLLLLLTGCSCEPGETPSADTPEVETTEVVFNAEGAPTVAFDVPGLHCSVCAKGVCGALEEHPGVVDLKIDIETKTATVAIDSAFDTKGALEALAEANFKEATLMAVAVGTAAEPLEVAEPANDTTEE